MAGKIRLDLAARQEFDEAFEWYGKRSAVAALAFAAEIDSAIEKIGESPDRFQLTFAGCRRCSLRRYPYCVVFYQTSDEIVIVAVAHLKRRPGYWRYRI